MLDDVQRERYKPAKELLKNWQIFKTSEIQNDEEKQTNWWIKPT